MKSSVSALLFAVPFLALNTQVVSAADEDLMLDKCRHYASKHLRISPDIINVEFEGQRSDGTYAVNGDAESEPPLTFQCSFRPNGRKISQFVFHAPEGCPVDVSEADRYKYPDCE